jgi:hypothetical protein
MFRTTLLTIALIALCGLLITGCSKKQEADQQQTGMPQGAQQPAQPELRQGPSNAVAGIHWTAPSPWKELPARQMRVVTYGVAGQGDGEGAECAVFYFGHGEGGDVEANIGRWVSQFEKPGDAVRSTKTVDGMNVVLVKVAGTYLAPAGPMMQSSGKKENYKLFGAIVSAPEGSVFFKFTGPAKVLDGAEKDFNALIESIAKQAKVS